MTIDSDYTISTTPGDRIAIAATFRDALTAVASQLTDKLPHGPVGWRITDPTGTEHRGSNALNGRPAPPPSTNWLTGLHSQLRRSADGVPRPARASAEDT
jgi:hypothetical protein